MFCPRPSCDRHRCSERTAAAAALNRPGGRRRPNRKKPFLAGPIHAGPGAIVPNAPAVGHTSAAAASQGQRQEKREQSFYSATTVAHGSGRSSGRVSIILLSKKKHSIRLSRNKTQRSANRIHTYNRVHTSGKPGTIRCVPNGPPSRERSRFPAVVRPHPQTTL